jgi:hypothetical protein
VFLEASPTWVERLALEAAARAEVEQPAGCTGRSMSACLRSRVEFVNAGRCLLVRGWIDHLVGAKRQP